MRKETIFDKINKDTNISLEEYHQYDVSEINKSEFKFITRDLYNKIKSKNSDVNKTLNDLYSHECRTYIYDTANQYNNDNFYYSDFSFGDTKLLNLSFSDALIANGIDGLFLSVFHTIFMEKNDGGYNDFYDDTVNEKRYPGLLWFKRFKVDLINSFIKLEKGILNKEEESYELIKFTDIHLIVLRNGFFDDMINNKKELIKFLRMLIHSKGSVLQLTPSEKMDVNTKFETIDPGTRINITTLFNLYYNLILRK